MIAKRTGGQYFVGVDAMYDDNDKSILPSNIAANDQETYITGNPDHRFKKLMMGWLLSLIAGVLCFEWLIRRLSKLA